MSKSIQIRPWEIQAGDRVLGTSLVATGEIHYSQTDIGSDRERQRFHVVLTDGREIPYCGESWLSVIRGEVKHDME